MPNRIIKESICVSDSIDSLSWFEEVLFYRLIVVCDDYGRFDGRIPIIKGKCFPLKDLRNGDIEKALDKLSAVGMVEKYEVQGRPYLQLIAWERHQQIRAKKSKYPASDNTCNQLISDAPVIQSESNPNPNRESPPISPVSRFEEFFSAYPKSGNRQAAEVAYCKLLMDDANLSEENLIVSVKNYAEACRIKETEEQYIKDPQNFLKDNFFVQYLEGNYKKPKPSERKQNRFNQFQQNEYDFERLEKRLLNRKGEDSC